MRARLALVALVFLAACGAIDGETAPDLTLPPGTARASVVYVAIGSSESAGVGASDPATRGWTALLAARMPPGSTFHNAATPAATVRRATPEQLPRAVEAGASVITLWLGVTDMNGLHPTQAYASDLGDLLDALLAKTQARIFVGNLPNLALAPAYRAYDPAYISYYVDAYNRAIGEITSARGRRVVAVDLHTGSEALLGAAALANDGFHPNDRGHQLIADRFAAAMRAAGVPVR